MRGRGVKAKARVPLGRRLLRKLPLLLVLVAATGVVIALPFAARAAYRRVTALSFFRINDVKVFGLKYVRKDDFLNYVGNPVGQSIVNYDIKEALKKTSGHPWIKSATVRRDFPHTVRFEFSERVPAAIAVTKDGRYLIDTDGYAVAKVDGAGWNFLPLIEYRPAAGLRLLDPVAAPVLQDVLDLAKAVREEPSERLTGARMCVSENGEPCLMLGGALVRVGGGDYQQKVRRLADVVQDIKRRGVQPSLIDLRFPGKVIVKEGKGQVMAAAETKPEGGE